MVLVVFAAACGGSPDDQAGSPQPGTVDGPLAFEVDPAADTAAGSEPAEESEPERAREGEEPEPGSLAELEARWAARRAAVVAEIKARGYGVDDGVLEGPGGLTVDLSRCPDDWVDGLDDGRSIVLGYPTARSGSLQTYGFLADGLQAYFDHVNDTGGIDGRQIELLVVDDRYQADLTQALVGRMLAGQLLDDDSAPFAVTTLGYPATRSVHEELNESCVPQPFVVSNHPAWGDPERFPWTTGLQLSHAAEAVIWGQWIESNLAADLPVKVAALFSDDAFGRAYESAFRNWAEAHPEVVSELVAVAYDPMQELPTITSEMTTIRATEPDVVLAIAAGSYCGLAVTEAATAGLVDTTLARFTSAVCRDPDLYFKPAGEAADGWRIALGGLESTTDPNLADDPFVRFTNQTLAEVGLEPAVGFYGAGFAVYGWAHVEALRIAAELEGGITRSNFLLAQRALDLEHPMVTPGVSFSTSGAADPYPIEGSAIGVFSASSGTWETEGVIDADGATPSCSWDDGC